MNITSIAALETYAGALSQSHKKIMLRGDLGTGKTTFTKGYVAGLGVDSDQVTSPTYTYINTYQHSETDRPILHVDMYRLKSYEQAYELGIFDLIDEHEYVIIERPQREDEYADQSWYEVTIEKVDETSRHLEGKERSE